MTQHRMRLASASLILGLTLSVALGGPQVHNVTQDTWHATIQAAIDGATAGDTLSVYPGNYDETAAGRFVLAPSGMGPYQFGLFIPHDKPGLTIQGVDAGGAPITSAAAVVAHITTNATNPFGYSGTFLEADDTTLTGLDFGPNAAGTNKTIEVIADNLTIRHCIISDVESGYGGGSLYINDWQYDDGGTPGDTSDDTSHIQQYHVEGCHFPNGASLDLADGAGFSGPPSGRKILDNTFDLSYSEFPVTWPVISFNGADTGVPWFIWSVGGAAITGNTFQYGDGALQYIRARGTYDNSQFDWSSYWHDNTYAKAVVFGAAPPATLGTYSVIGFYGPIDNIRRIGATIQGEADHAAAGDTVLAAAGLYEEQVILDGLDNLTLRGSGSGDDPALHTIIRSPLAAALTPTPAWGGGTVRAVVAVLSATGVLIDDLRVDGLNRCTCGSDMVGISYWEAGGTIQDCVVTHVRDNPLSGCQDGVALHADNDSAGPFTLDVVRTHLREYQKNGTAFAGIGRTITMTDCSATGAGPSTVIAQNGIQIAYGASGALLRCDIRDHFWTGPTWSASGVLAYGTSGTVNLEACDLRNNQTGYLAAITAGGELRECDFRNPVEPVVAPGGFQSNGVFLYTDGSAVNGPAEFTRAAKYGPARPVAVDGDVPMVVEIRHSQFRGSDAAGTVGVWSYTEGAGSLTVQLSHSLIRDWDYGILSEEEGGALHTHAHLNTIASNVTGGFLTSPATTTVQDAVDNYWGAPDGPADPGGTIETDGSACPAVTDITNQVGTLGNAVSDETVAYCPWLSAPATIALLPQGGDVCYEPGDTLVVEVTMTAAKTVIVGGQFYLNYDTSRLAYLDGEPAAATCAPGPNPFCTELIDITPSAGTIFYSVGVNPIGGIGTTDDSVLARLTFEVLDPLPATCQLAGLIGFEPDLGGLQTKLSDSSGAPVIPEKQPLPAISVDTASPSLAPVVVVGGAVDGDCERLVTFSTTVDDDCCLTPAGLSGSAMILSGSATLSGFALNAVTVDGDTVTVSGSVLVSAVTACPVEVQITVTAVDCCGNSASLSGTADVFDDTPPTFVAACPLPPIAVNSDANTGCGAAASFVNPVAPAALDNCDGSVLVDGARSDSQPLSAVYPVGTTTITWTATDDCGNTATCTQDVVVAAENVLNVTVELSPLVVAGTFTRCITFRLYDCSPTPSVLEIERELTFTGGVATDSFAIPCGTYECVTARDRRHSLRSTATPTILPSGQYEVSFTGARPDESLPGAGNRLLGGNLNDDFYIDILDFGVYTFQYAQVYAPGGSDCATPYPHADINGDGFVGTIDFSFILNNFLRGHQPNCCALSDELDDEGRDGPILRIAVPELAARGLGHLAAADLNRDGWLDVADIGAFLAGALPQLPGENMQELEELKRLYQQNLLGFLGDASTPLGHQPAESGDQPLLQRANELWQAEKKEKK